VTASNEVREVDTNIGASGLEVQVDTSEFSATAIDDFPILFDYALDAAANRYGVTWLQMLCCVRGTHAATLLDHCDWDDPIVNDRDRNDVLAWIDRTSRQNQRDCH